MFIQGCSYWVPKMYNWDGWLIYILFTPVSVFIQDYQREGREGEDPGEQQSGGGNCGESPPVWCINWNNKIVRVHQWLIMCFNSRLLSFLGDQLSDPIVSWVRHPGHVIYGNLNWRSSYWGVSSEWIMFSTFSLKNSALIQIKCSLTQLIPSPAPPLR